MPEFYEDPQSEVRVVPVVHRDMPEGVAAAVDHSGNAVVGEWITVTCSVCGSKGSMPKEAADGYDPDPETGEYVAACGRCLTGRKINYFTGSAPANRAERRAKNRH